MDFITPALISPPLPVPNIELVRCPYNWAADTDRFQYTREPILPIVSPRPEFLLLSKKRPSAKFIQSIQSALHEFEEQLPSGLFPYLKQKRVAVVPYVSPPIVDVEKIVNKQTAGTYYSAVREVGLFEERMGRKVPKIVLAHELGHAVSRLARKAFMEDFRFNPLRLKYGKPIHAMPLFQDAVQADLDALNQSWKLQARLASFHRWRGAHQPNKPYFKKPEEIFAWLFAYFCVKRGIDPQQDAAFDTMISCFPQTMHVMCNTIMPQLATLKADLL